MSTSHAPHLHREIGSRQLSMMVAPRLPVWTDQASVTRPEDVERAPWRAALAASSCNTMLSATVAFGEIRMVAGTLYAHVDLKEIGRLAKAGGVDDFDAQVDDAVTSADPSFAQGLRDVRAGKWIKLPLSDYLDKLKDLAKRCREGCAPCGESNVDVPDPCPSPLAADRAPEELDARSVQQGAA